MTSPPDLLERSREYLRLLSLRGDDQALVDFFCEDVVQEEFPNRLLPQGARRGLQELLEGRAKGRQVMSAESYEVLSALVTGDRVALEVQWTGTLSIPLGTLPVGGQMRARFAVFLDFRDGKIARQRNYDCFDAW